MYFCSMIPGLDSERCVHFLSYNIQDDETVFSRADNAIETTRRLFAWASHSNVNPPTLYGWINP